MIQILNIFKKDARRHWPEILISFALMALFTRILLQDLTQHFGGRESFVILGGLFAQLEHWITPLLPVAWIFLITRVIQSEPLVGDRQFWVTRPYDWKKLLAAKALFLVVFISIPLLIQDAILLIATGFHPTSYLSGLLYIQWMWLVIFVLVAALAAVTASIGQMLLALLAVVLYFACTAAAVQWIPNSSFSTGRSSWFENLPLVAAGAILLLQYSRRRTSTSRAIILCLAAALWLIDALTPYRKQINETYPLAAGSPALITIPSNIPDPIAYTSIGGDSTIQFPIGVAGLLQDFMVRLDGVIVTLTNSAGVHWDSGWKVQNRLLFSDQKPFFLDLQIPRRNFDQLKPSPLSAHILLAYTFYRNQNQRTFVVPNGNFSLPELGNCTVGTDYLRRINNTYGPGVSCLAPIRRPEFLLITSEVAANTCPAPRPTEFGPIVRGVIQGGSGPVESIITPVTQIYLNLTNWETQNSYPGPCPGTPLTLSNPVVAANNRIEFHLDNVTLADKGTGRFILRP